MAVNFAVVELQDKLSNYIKYYGQNRLRAEEIKALVERLGDDKEQYGRMVCETVTSNGENVLHVAAKAGHNDIIISILQTLPEKYCFMALSQKRQMGGIGRLLSCMGRECKSNTPVHYAVRNWIKTDSGTFNAIMQEGSLTSMQKLEVLSMTDELGRTAMGLVEQRRDVDREKRNRMVNNMQQVRDISRQEVTGMSGQIKLLREEKTRLELVNEKLKKQMQDQEETMGNMVKRLDTLEEENSVLKTKIANWDRDLDARMSEMFDRRLNLQFEKNNLSGAMGSTSSQNNNISMDSGIHKSAHWK